MALNSVKWHMPNCACVLEYDYDKELIDTPENRINHRHISKCDFHAGLVEKELHDELCNEMTQVSSCYKKIAELHPEVLKVSDQKLEIDPNKVFVGFDEKRALVAVVDGLDDQKTDQLKTELEAITDRAVEVK